MVEGLEGERTALVAKVHHAILDGVSGASVLAAFLDLTPRTRVVSLPTEWDPAPLPSNAQMLRHAASSLARQPGSALSTLQAGVEAVADLGMHNRELAGRGEQSPPGLLRGTADVVQRRRLEPQALRRPVGPARGREARRPGLRGHGERRDPGLRLGWAAPAAGRPRRGGRELARGHGAGLGPRPKGRPRSWGTRSRGCSSRWPPTIDDPVGRLDAISESARVAKEQEKLHGGRFVGDLAQIALPALASRVARAVAGTRLFDKMRPPFNVTVSSVRVPGRPAVPGREPGRRHLSGGAHGRGHRAQRDGLLVSRPGVLRDAGLPPAPPRARPGGGARRRRAGELVVCALDAQGATA